MVSKFILSINVLIISLALVCPTSAEKWLVFSDSDEVGLHCEDKDHFPFNEVTSADRIRWILPKSFGQFSMKAGQVWGGFSVSDNGTKLTIDRTQFSKNADSAGHYLCAKLIDKVNSTDTANWYYLRIGFNLYRDNPVFKTGNVWERYRVNFSIAFTCLFSYLAIVLTVYVAWHFGQKRYPSASTAITDTIQSPELELRHLGRKKKVSSCFEQSVETLHTSF